MPAPPRVYLDQNKWVDLARAETGHRLGDRYSDLLAIARRGVATRLVSFPLSMVHYMETLGTRSGRRRQDVGGIMAELSQMVTMASSDRVLPGEIDRALRDRWGHPTDLREIAIFGHGVGHAFGSEEYRYHVPEESKLDPETKAMIEVRFQQVLEESVIRGPVQDFPYAGIDPRDDQGMSQRHSDGERDLGVQIRRLNRYGNDFREAWIARTLAELAPQVTEALLRAGISPTAWVDLGRDGMTAFLEDLPVAHAVFEIRYRRHRDPALPWRPQDLLDMHGLAMAVVHCDVVVCERHVAALMTEAGLDKRHGTRILTDLADLVEVLVSSA